jgi:flagellar protein FliO/FliZ
MNFRSLFRALVVAVMSGLMIPAAALAADGEKTPLNLPSAQNTAETAAPGAGGGLVRTIVGLAIVLAVIYGLYWVLKQVKSSRETAASGQGLESVASIPLGTNRSLHLVRAGTELVLLGVADQAVVPIRAYREEEARALGLIGGADTIEADTASPSKPTPASAALALRDVFGRLQQRTVRS